MSRVAWAIFLPLAVLGTGFMALSMWANAVGDAYDMPFIKGLLLYIVALQVISIAKKGK